MKWKLYNLTRLWVLSAGLLAFSWPRSSSAETFDTWLHRYMTNSVAVSALEWYLSGAVPMGDQHNYNYCTVVADPESAGNTVFATPLDASTIYEPRFHWYTTASSDCATYFSIFRYSPSIASYRDPRQVFASQDCVVYNPGGPVCDDTLRPDWPMSPIYISPDPVFGRGVCIPIYTATVGDGCHINQSSPTHWETCDFESFPYEEHGLNLYMGRAYVLPQRVKVVSESGYDASQLWDMYGDGRLFLPRFIYDDGLLSQYNCSPFDEDLWAQLQFYPSSTETFRSSVFYSNIQDYTVPGGQKFQRSATFTRFNGRLSSQGNLLYRIQNLKHFTVSTNLVDPSLFPSFEELLRNHLKLPLSPDTGNSWRSWTYIPQSLQFGDFGYYRYNTQTYSDKPPSSPQGCVGIIVKPVSSTSGGYCSFRHFYLVPCSEYTGSVAPQNRVIPVARLITYKPSGIAWDKDGALCFDYVKSGLGLPDLLKWPYTSSWDFDFSVYVVNNGNLLPKVYTFPSQPKPGPNSIPIPENPPVAGVPPVPAPRATGGSQPHFPIPFLGGPQGVGSGNGTSLLGQGQDSWRLNGNLSTITHSSAPTAMPVDDNGDLQGDYSLSYPGMSDLYDLDAFATVTEQQYTQELVDYASLWADEIGNNENALVGDFAQRGTSTGQFGSSVQQSNLGNSPVDPRLFGRFDTSKSWFYTYLPSVEPILPKTKFLVVPVVRQDWDTGGVQLQDEPFELPESYAAFRPILLVLVSVGLSAWFIMLVMKLFQGGN